MAPEAISDTGPPLHLHEIDCLGHLAPLSPLAVPDLVRAELEGFGLQESDLAAAGVQIVAASEHRIDALCTRSTLHLSRPFREYLRRLLAGIG